MKLVGNGSIEDISSDVSGQRVIKEAEDKLRRLVHKTPITIEYGCNKIHLQESKTSCNGLNFSVLSVNKDGIHISMH